MSNLVKDGIWIEGTREKADHALNCLRNVDTRWKEGDNECSHRDNQTARQELLVNDVVCRKGENTSGAEGNGARIGA
jgi:hypothetical protein